MELKPMSQRPLDLFKGLIHGGPGSGVTSLATTIAELGQTLYIYLKGEEGLEAIPLYVRDNVYPVNPKSIEDVQKLYWFLATKKHKFSAVVFEGLTHWQRIYNHYVQNFDEDGFIPLAKGDARARLRMTDQRRIGGRVGSYLQSEIPVWYQLANASRSRPIHVVMTAQSRFRQVWSGSDDDDEDKGELIREYIGPDIFPNLISHAEAAPNWILYCEKGENALGEVQFLVKSGPDPLIITKTREPADRPADERWPAVAGEDGSRVTLPQLIKHTGV